MATIYDVAEIAEVSPATVSRVFSDPSKVSPEKVRRVRGAAARLKFTAPNRTARRLRRRTSELIALLIPDVENPFFAAMAKGVEGKASEVGLSLVLCNTDDDPEKETRYLDIANSENMAGLILAPSAKDGDISHATDRGRPVVGVDRDSGLGIDTVMVDNRSIGAEMTNALVNRGFKRIACIAGPRHMEWTEGRALGWRDVTIERFGRLNQEYFEHGNYRVDGGRAALENLLALPDPPDAVVVTNNLMGVGVLEALAERGISPKEFGLGVVGEIPFAPARNDVLQARLPARDLGVTAANLLVERIGGDEQPPRTVMLRAELLNA